MALIEACEQHGWLAEDFIPPGSDADGAAPSAWLAEATVALARHVG